MFDRYQAEALIQALVGGGLPEHLNIILFNREVGWKLASLQDLAELIEEDEGESPFSVLWENIEGIPTEFPPEDHTHTASEITDFTEEVGDAVELAIDRIVCDEDFDVVVDEDFNVVMSE